MYTHMRDMQGILWTKIVEELATKINKERASAVVPQLRERRRLSALCGHQFRSLMESISHAEEKGFIDENGLHAKRML
jgi:hypothetical protein